MSTLTERGAFALHRPHPLQVLLRLLAAAGLVVSGYIHYDLHDKYQFNKGSLGVTEGRLFIAQAVAAFVVAALVLLLGGRLAWLLAALVLVGSFAVIMITRYNNIGAVGPIPNLYEPIWFKEKKVAAIVEGAASVLTLGWLLWSFAPRRRA